MAARSDEAARARVRVGVFARTFPGTTPLAVLTQARDAGFDDVQYNMACSGLPSLPSAVAHDQVALLRHAMHDTGVGIFALSATANLIHPDPVLRAAGLQSVAALAHVAQQLDIPLLTLCSGSRNVADQWASHPDNTNAGAWNDLLGSMRALVDVATHFDVRLGIEPEPGNVVRDAVVARRLLDELQSDRVGIILDAANLIEPESHTTPVSHTTPASRADVIAHAIDVLADRIVLVHAKDRDTDGGVVVPGRGVVDFGRYFRDLASACVQAPVIAHGLDAGEAASTAAFLRARLEMR